MRSGFVCVDVLRVCVSACVLGLCVWMYLEFACMYVL